jgi:hypothetical protein
VIEGLKKLRVYCEPNEWDLSFDLTFEGVAAPFQEPHFLRYAGPRVMMDYTRLTQTGRWSGTLKAGGRTFEVTRDGWRGARDHSWGIRPVGDAEPRGAPPPGAKAPGFFWVWSPSQYDAMSMMFTCSEDSDGERWHAACELLYPHESGRDPEPLNVVGHEIRMQPGTRTFDRGRLLLARRDGTPLTVRMEPKTTICMAGAGYAYFGGWRHGQYHGPLAVEGETWDLKDPARVAQIGGQTETICDFTIEEMPEVGTGSGIIEFLVLGAYEPYGFKQWNDVAPAK